MDVRSRNRRDLQPRTFRPEELEEDAPGLRRVVLLVLSGGQPIPGPGRVRGSTECVERLRRLGGGPNRVGTAAKAAEGLGSAAHQLGALPTILAGFVEQAVVLIERLLEPAGCEQQVGLQAAHRRSLLRDEVRHRYAEALREEREGRHRRLRQAALEGADVRGRIAAVGNLRLGHAGADARLADPIAHASGDMAVVDDDHPSRAGRCSGHAQMIRVAINP
jgi:hypothetical protein